MSETEKSRKSSTKAASSRGSSKKSLSQVEPRDDSRRVSVASADQKSYASDEFEEDRKSQLNGNDQEQEEEKPTRNTSLQRPKTAGPNERSAKGSGDYIEKLELYDEDSFINDAPITENKKKIIGMLDDKLPPPTVKTAYKRHNSVYPCASKILAKKWDDVTMKKHREKIKTMKACIDNHAFKSDVDPKLRSLKKNIAKAEYAKKIARDNRILIDRMARTLAKPQNNFEKQHQKTCKDLEYRAKVALRIREQKEEKIQHENRLLVARLESKKATYEKKKWATDRKSHLRYLLNMTKFPEAYKSAIKRETLEQDSRLYRGASAPPRLVSAGFLI